MAPGLRAEVWYNNHQPYGLAGYINDASSRMIGYATLRQMRVAKGESKINHFNRFLKLTVKNKIYLIRQNLINPLLLVIFDLKNLC